MYFPQMTVKTGHCAEIRCTIFTGVWLFAGMDTSMFLWKIQTVKPIFQNTKQPNESSDEKFHFIQTIKSQFFRNPLPQTSQTSGLFITPLWVSMCTCKLCFWRNFRSHWVHLYSSSAWIFLCLRNESWDL